MDARVTYWIELSDYDLKTASVMLDGKRFLYVGFMVHQSIEKILKAYYVMKYNEIPPFSHRLSLLAKRVSVFESLSEEQKDFMDLIEPLNIEARYPSNKEQLMKSLTEERCRDIVKKAEELHTWIKQKLLKS
jgi:HEPN domain-containing protein